MKIRIFYLRFLYSQDLSNYKTMSKSLEIQVMFLYSQDLSNLSKHQYL